MKKLSQVNIYENYGMLGSEFKAVFSTHPCSEAYNQITVAAPDGWVLWQDSIGRPFIGRSGGTCFDFNMVLTNHDGHPSIHPLDFSRQEPVRLKIIG